MIKVKILLWLTYLGSTEGGIFKIILKQENGLVIWSLLQQELKQVKSFK